MTILDTLVGAIVPRHDPQPHIPSRGMSAEIRQSDRNGHAIMRPAHRSGGSRGQTANRALSPFASLLDQVIPLDGFQVVEHCVEELLQIIYALRVAACFAEFGKITDGAAHTANILQWLGEETTAGSQLLRS